MSVSWLLVWWACLNLVLFAMLLRHGLQVRRLWPDSPLRAVATALALVAGTFLVSALQRIGIHAARVGLLPAAWEDVFLTGFQVVLSAIGTAAGVYSVTRLREALRRVARGERMVGVLTDSAGTRADIASWRLTAREAQVLDTILTGRTSDGEIAETLFIASSTAATHVRNILRKAGLSNRLDLMLVAGRSRDLERGALPPIE